MFYLTELDEEMIKEISNGKEDEVVLRVFWFGVVFVFFRGFFFIVFFFCVSGRINKI